MKVAPRQNFVGLGEHHRIVGGGVDLNLLLIARVCNFCVALLRGEVSPDTHTQATTAHLEHVVAERDGLFAHTVNLRHATQRVGILHLWGVEDKFLLSC